MLTPYRSPRFQRGFAAKDWMGYQSLRVHP